MITKLTEWQSAMLEKLVGDEMIRARQSGCSSDQTNDLAMLMDTLETADVLHVETRAQWPLRSATKSRSTATPISTDLSQSQPKRNRTDD